jgi:hypothetical protein
VILIVILVSVERIFSVAQKGDLFKPGALRQAFHEFGKYLWWGMVLFVILHFFWLALVYYVQHR